MADGNSSMIFNYWPWGTSYFFCITLQWHMIHWVKNFAYKATLKCWNKDLSRHTYSIRPPTVFQLIRTITDIFYICIKCDLAWSEYWTQITHHPLVPHNIHIYIWLLKKVQTQVICTTMVSWIIPIVRQSVNHKKILWVIHKQQKNYIENHKNTPQSIKKTCYNIKCTYKYHFTSLV